MKKTVLIIAASLLTVAASAQNKMWLSGSASFNSTNYDPGDTKMSGGVFGPAFGYMVTDNIAVGLGLNYSSQKTENTNDGSDNIKEMKVNGFTVNPFVRYYKMLADNKLGLYGEFNIGIGSSTESYSGVTDSQGNDITDQYPDHDYKTFSLAIAPGIQYWFADDWSINAQFGALRYQSNTYVDGATDDNGDPTDAKQNDMYFGLDLSSMNFGLNYHF